MQQHKHCIKFIERCICTSVTSDFNRSSNYSSFLCDTEYIHITLLVLNIQVYLFLTFLYLPFSQLSKRVANINVSFYF